MLNFFGPENELSQQPLIRSGGDGAIKAERDAPAKRTALLVSRPQRGRQRSRTTPAALWIKQRQLTITQLAEA